MRQSGLNKSCHSLFAPGFLILQGGGCERAGAAISRRSCSSRLPLMTPTLFLGHMERMMTAWCIIALFPVREALWRFPRSELLRGRPTLEHHVQHIPENTWVQFRDEGVSSTRAVLQRLSDHSLSHDSSLQVTFLLAKFNNNSDFWPSKIGSREMNWRSNGAGTTP